MNLPKRFIMLFIFSILAISMKVSAICSIGVSNSFSDSSSFTSDVTTQDSNNIHKALSLSFAEIAGKSITESFSFTNNVRLRRSIVDYFNIIKKHMSLLCIRESLLVSDRSKLFYSNMSSHCMQTCSDYYVFSLRHILI